MKSSERSSSTTSRRTYDSSRRQAAAQERQRRVLEAATELFLEHGYGATSINQIAKAADVSPQSVYATFDGKAGILEAAVNLARTGAASGGNRDSAEAETLMAESDPRKRCQLTAAFLRQVNEGQAAPLIAIVERASASDPALADLHTRFRDQRRASVEMLTSSMPTKAFRKGLKRQEAIDAMTFLSAGHTYTELVEELGWSPARFESWLADALYQLLFAD